ncbi:uncharacterized protein akap12a [Nerophis lumbriciformis]|uniref:uncharacterized protein akap12a n=1 Tax=Nerophis lumbriciformis TaxID=546530 RepID=UPI003BAC5AC5
MGDAQSARRASSQEEADAAAADDMQHHNEKLITNGKSDGPSVEVHGLCEDDVTSQAEEDPEKPPEEMETQLENITMKESSKAADQEVSLVDSQVEEKHDDLNESFKKLLNKFGLKFTLKQVSSDHAEIGHVPEADTEELPVESVVDSVRTEQTMTLESESMCPTQGETGEKVQQDIQTHKPDVHEEWTHLETTSEHDPASSTEDDVTMSPVKRFFTTGIFAVRRKKRQLEEDEIITRELVQQDAEETAPDQHDETNEMSPCTDAAKDSQEEIPSNHPVSEPKMSQETENIQASPLKRLLLKSSLIKLPRKQRDEKPIDVELPGGCQLEPTAESEQLGSTTNLTIDPKKENTAEVTAEEEKSAWATFIKLLSPKKRLNRSLLDDKDTQIMISKEDEILERSMEESKKRSDSVVSWDSILCGSGRRRSNRPSDSDEETPPADPIYGLKNGVEETEISKDNSEILASSPKQAGSPVEVDGESPWNAFKRLLSPKRKAKREGVSESDMIREDSSFSSKIFLGQKNRKSVTKKDQVASPCEPDQNLTPDESEIPAIVPLSEFDAVEANVEAKETNVERKVSNEPDQVTEQDQPLDDLQSVDTTVQHYLDNKARTNEDLDDLTEFISNQLSDIPEESEMTQTMATPGSATKDLMSEAITAPVSADSTLANESEMISANSQISESLNTSGDTTPVPAEPEVKETERLLKQVVETIFTMPEVEPLINSSASDQILETFAQEELKTLEGNKSDVATTNEKDKTPAMANISKVIEACSIETPPQIPNKVLDTIEMTVNDAKEADRSQAANTTNKLDSSDKVHDYVGCVIDVNGSPKLLSNSKEMITGAAESKDGAADWDVQTLLDTIDKPPVKDHPHALDGDLQKKRKQKENNVQQVEREVMLDDFPADEVKGKSDNLPGALTEEPKPPKDILPEAVLDSAAKGEVLEKCIVEPVEDYIIPVTIKFKKATAPLQEVCAEPEIKDDAEESVYASKKEISHKIKITEDLEAKELELDDTSIQAIKSKETSKTICPKEKVRENLYKDSLLGDQDHIEIEDTEARDAPEFELIREENISVASQQTFQSGEVAIQAIDHNVLLENILAKQCLSEEPKEETVPMPKTKAEPEKDQKAHNDFETEMIKDVEVTEDDVQLVNAEEISAVTLAEETVNRKVQNRSLPLTEVNLEHIRKDIRTVDAVTTKRTQKQEITDELQGTDVADVPYSEDREVSEGIHLEKTVAEKMQEEKAPLVEKDTSKMKIIEVIEAEALSKQAESDKVLMQLLNTKEEVIFAEVTKTEYPKEKSEVPPTVVEPENEGQKLVGAVKTVIETETEKAATKKEQETTEGITDETTVPVEETSTLKKYQKVRLQKKL